jgi:hypothetical protein
LSKKLIKEVLDPEKEIESFIVDSLENFDGEKLSL